MIKGRSHLLELAPAFAALIDALLAHADALDLNPIVTDGFRSNAEQDELYKLGRTKPGRIVTRAKAGQSPHNYGLAVDITVKAGYESAEQHAIRALALQHNLVILGLWDIPHVEAPHWKDIARRIKQQEVR